MPIGIVDLLKKINVTNTQTEAFGIIRTYNKPVQIVPRPSSVAQSRKGIRICLLLKLHIIINQFTL